MVIPCRNGGRYIERLLSQLFSQDVSRDSYEVIVVDDGSEDDTCERVTRFENVRLLHQAHAGPGAARNLGTRAAKGRYVLYLDCDLEVPPDLLSRHLSHHRKYPQVGATGGSVASATNPRLCTWCQVDHFSSWFNAHPSASPAQGNTSSIEYLPSLNFCIDREKVFEQYQLSWPIGLKHTGEDVIFCMRLRKAGLELVFLPKAVVYHHDRQSLKAYLQHMWRWGYHAPFVRGENPELQYSFLFPRSRLLLLLTLPAIVLGYTWLIWRAWLRSEAVAVTLCLPQIALGRLAYAHGVFVGTVAKRQLEQGHTPRC